MSQALCMTSVRFISGVLLLLLVEAIAGSLFPESVLRRKAVETTFSSASTCLGRLFVPLPLGLDRQGSIRVTAVDRKALLWAGDDKLSDFTDVSGQPPPEPGAHKQVTVVAAAAANSFPSSCLAQIQVAVPTWPL